MENDLQKRKNELIKSIMKNPKLSKTFGEAFSAPIGSTKRKQAKSVFSIMKKINGNVYNGQGGCYDGQGGPSLTAGNYDVNSYGVTNTTTGQTQSQDDYGNTVIFPAAPALKKPYVKGAPAAAWDFWSKKAVPKIAETVGKAEAGAFNIGAGVTEYAAKNLGTIAQGALRGLTGYDPNTAKPLEYTKLGDTWGINNLADSQSIPKSLPGVAQSVQNAVGSNVQGPEQFQNFKVATDQYADSTVPVEQDAFSYDPPSFNSDGTVSSSKAGSTGSYSGSPTSGDSSILDKAKSAVNQGTGAGFFAMDVANEKFGGSLDEYINKLDEKLRTDFDLTGLESELSNLKAAKQNLIPTMTQYIKGKDQYLKFIDQMIDKTEGNLMKQDMGNPAVAKSYNNYMNYLYTLKGRQNERYGNYLNSAIDEYNSDLERTESNYKNVYGQYENVINRKSAIAESEYTTLYNTMADLYTNLDGAEEKRLNLDLLYQQKTLNNVKIANELANQSGTSYDLKNVQKYTDYISDKEGSLSTDVLGAAGLAGFFNEVIADEGTAEEAIKAINIAMSTAISKSGGEIKTVKDLKGLIDDLSALGGEGAELASRIYPTFKQKLSDSELVSNYVLNNIGDIKDAAKSLAKNGFQDVENWKQDNNSVDTSILGDIYEIVDEAVNYGGAPGNNPKLWVSNWTSGDDKTAATRIANDIIFSW